VFVVHRRAKFGAPIPKLVGAPIPKLVGAPIVSVPVFAPTTSIINSNPSRNNNSWVITFSTGQRQSYKKSI
jgi:hypothetical protein